MASSILSETLEPFGLYFRQVLPVQPSLAQTTSEPEITTGDGKDPDKIDADWVPDDDEDKDDDDEKTPKKSLPGGYALPSSLRYLSCQMETQTITGCSALSIQSSKDAY